MMVLILFSLENGLRVRYLVLILHHSISCSLPVTRGFTNSPWLQSSAQTGNSTRTRHAGFIRSVSFPTCCSALPDSALSTGIALILSPLQCNNTHCLISVWWMKSFNETGPNCSGKLPYFCVLNGSDPSAAARTLSLSLQPPLMSRPC